MSTDSVLKEKLIQYCKDHVAENIQSLEEAMNSRQESANAELKGSAGDKHETGRAMMHLEKENLAKQLAERMEVQKVVSQLKLESLNDEVRFGNLVITDAGKFFLSIAIGKASIDGEIMFILSPQSPMGAALMGKKEGEEFTFNYRQIKVKKIL